jgi:hypothetical protein
MSSQSDHGNRIQLSKNFYLDEFTRSQTAARHGLTVNVETDSAVFENLRILCRQVLQPLRDTLGPVHITSGYRPLELNRLLGSDDDSQHVFGEAADIVVSGHRPLAVCNWIDSHCDYDQLIHEFGQWTHVSISQELQRQDLLTAQYRNGTAYYYVGLREVAA